MPHYYRERSAQSGERSVHSAVPSVQSEERRGESGKCRARVGSIEGEAKKICDIQHVIGLMFFIRVNAHSG